MKYAIKNEDISYINVRNDSFYINYKVEKALKADTNEIKMFID